MERITRFRAGVLLVIFCLIVGFFALKLYDLQIIQTEADTLRAISIVSKCINTCSTIAAGITLARVNNRLAISINNTRLCFAVAIDEVCISICSIVWSIGIPVSQRSTNT